MPKQRRAHRRYALIAELGFELGLRARGACEFDAMSASGEDDRDDTRRLIL